MPYLQYLADHCKLVATLRRHARLTGMDSVYQHLYTHVLTRFSRGLRWTKRTGSTSLRFTCMG